MLDNANLNFTKASRPLFHSTHVSYDFYFFARLPVNSGWKQVLIGWFLCRDTFALIPFALFSNTVYNTLFLTR